MLKRAASAVLLAMLLAAPNLLSAQAQTVGWTRCTTGDFASCQSVQLTTVGVFLDAVRVGTDVSITMHNLSGQSGDDNTAWSGLYDAGFYAPAVSDAPFMTAEAQLAFDGGTTGDASPWSLMIVAGRIFASAPTHDQLIGGCMSGVFKTFSVAAQTCGTDAVATLSARFAWDLDASNYTSYSFETYGQSEESSYHYFGSCSVYSTGEAGPCSTFGLDTPAPEPITLALVATGFLGVGALRLRQRKTKAVAA